MKDSKIGIATFHCAENYGAFLQSYALYRWIQSNVSCKVLIINYRPDYLRTPYKISFRRRLRADMTFGQRCKAFIVFCLEVPYRLIRKLKFKREEMRLSLTKKYTSADFELDSSFSGLILGSDQIWNTSLTHGVDPVYFGAIAHKPCRKIAYAASVGLSRYPDEIEKNVKEKLSQLDYIGVREKEAATMIQLMIQKQAVVNVDPVFLVDRTFWKQFDHPVRVNNYILVYCVRNNPCIMQDAYKLAHTYNKKILHFGDPSFRTKYQNIEIHSLSYCGPFEFINYIAHADIILTDSFHATCFSIISNRRFFTYLNKTRSERLLTLAAIGKCSDRLVEWNETLQENNISCAFEATEDYYQNFSVERKKSQKYLMDALKGIF